MCEHCEHGKPLIDDGNFHVSIENNRFAYDDKKCDYIVRIEINNCPMCGRDLYEDQ